MSLSIAPVQPERPGDFVGEVAGIDLRRPPTRADIEALDAGMDRFAILVFRDQDVSDEQQLAFTRCFGEIELATGDVQQQSQTRRLRAEINDISNVDEGNRVLAADDRRRLNALNNRSWHSDSSYKPTPAKYSLLSARIIPSVNADTEFADMRAAWDALPDHLKAMTRDLVSLHSQFYSRSLLGYSMSDFSEGEKRYFTPVEQRLVRRHPKTGRLSLYLSSHAGAIVGWPVPESKILLRELIEHATQREFVYRHVWRPRDLVMWDNRVTMHRSTRYDGKEIRDLHRTTVGDVAPTLAQPA